MSVNIAIIQFPGSNCERETMLAVKRAGMTPIEFLWNEPPEKLLNCMAKRMRSLKPARR